MTGFPLNPPAAPIAGPDGRVSPEWYRFFVAIQRMLGSGASSPFDDTALISYQHNAPPADDDAGLLVPRYEMQVSDDMLSPYYGQALAAMADEAAGFVEGPASATDNAIARFDTTTGRLIQNSAATIDDDGAIRSAINSGANAVSVPLCNWVKLASDYTLTSTTAAQQIFNNTANGALTLPAGEYQFEAFLYLTNMSATTGNAQFHLLGAGTATVDRVSWGSYGIDSNSPFATGTRTGVMSIVANHTANLATNATALALGTTIIGSFRISAAGTIIPSVALTTAAAAVVKANSRFSCVRIGESSETYLGDWS